MGGELQEVGEVMHLTKSGRFIVRLTQSGGKQPITGEILLDQFGKAVLKVIEVIGPVAAPFASATPLTDRKSKVIGIRVYKGDSSSSKRQDNLRRRQLKRKQ
jgi:RNA-binding protein